MGYRVGVSILGSGSLVLHPAVLKTKREAEALGLRFMWEKELAVDYKVIHTDRHPTHQLQGGVLEETKSEVPSSAIHQDQV
jgi:hypothetical protein